MPSATILAIGKPKCAPGGRRVFDAWYKMQALLKSGALKPDPLITDRMALAEFDRGVQLLLSGNASKVLLYPDGQP